MRVLSIERILVAEKHLEVRVRVNDPRLTRTSADPGLPQRALEALPGLARHRCDNDANMRFVDELRDTETPHLLEHITVELMALSGASRSLPGRTWWDFAEDGPGIFHLRIAFDDDVVALGALKQADLLVDWLFGFADRPDVQAVAEDLKALRAQATKPWQD